MGARKRKRKSEGEIERDGWREGYRWQGEVGKKCLRIIVTIKADMRDMCAS